MEFRMGTRALPRALESGDHSSCWRKGSCSRYSSVRAPVSTCTFGRSRICRYSTSFPALPILLHHKQVIFQVVIGAVTGTKLDQGDLCQLNLDPQSGRVCDFVYNTVGFGLLFSLILIGTVVSGGCFRDWGLCRGSVLLAAQLPGELGLAKRPNGPCGEVICGLLPHNNHSLLHGNHFCPHFTPDVFASPPPRQYYTLAKARPGTLTAGATIGLAAYAFFWYLVFSITISIRGRQATDAGQPGTVDRNTVVGLSWIVTFAFLAIAILAIWERHVNKLPVVDDELKRSFLYKVEKVSSSGSGNSPKAAAEVESRSLSTVQEAHEGLKARPQ